MKNKSTIVDTINALLPQTQCGLCEYTGCKPYAEAIADGDAINKCLPGGLRVLNDLSNLMQVDPTPFINDMRQKYKAPSVAVIRENECIGCTKCIQACPVDAIIGSSKKMHTVFSDICNGCELCIEPCPVDCIDMVAIPERDVTDTKSLADFWRDRYENRNNRIEREENESKQKHANAFSHDAIAEALKRAKKL